MREPAAGEGAGSGQDAFCGRELRRMREPTDRRPDGVCEVRA
ncbi:MAG: hypothetical protein Q4C47_05695 [Planctomycetia bacterium]|nr:hypothetical protein [Planctomycetia bacterium]